MKIQYFLTAIFLILLLTVSCEKPEPPDEPTQKIKYISKVFDKDSLEVYESYTWDSQKRLQKFETRVFGTLNECNFFYNSEGLISRVDFFDFEYGYGNYMFYWKNKELDYVDFNFINSDGTPPFFTVMRFWYSFDENDYCTKIIQKYIGSDMAIHYFLEWKDDNMIKFYSIYDADSLSIVSDIVIFPYDDKYSFMMPFPKIPLLHFGKFICNSSANNPLHNGYYDLEYDYDEDGYPIRQYYFVDGKKELFSILVYEELPN